jgi:hypothetical protein
MRKVLVFGALVMVVPLAMATMADAKSGNNANAKACSKGGWTQLVTTDGASFASEKACTRYAAQGGTLVSRQDYFQGLWVQKCAELSGSSSTSTIDGVPGWNCDGTFTPNGMSHLATICANAGATFGVTSTGTRCSLAA